MISTIKRQHFCSGCVNRLTELMTFSHAKKKTDYDIFLESSLQTFRGLVIPLTIRETPLKNHVLSTNQVRHKGHVPCT